jgi:hypothetical protein
MSETITLQALDLSGETLTMFLRKSDGSLLNTGGDAMTESGSTGVFTATLAEARTGLGPLAVRICAGTETANNLLYDGFLVEGTTVIDSKVNAELDSSSVSAVADQVWDEDYADHNSAGSFGKLLNTIRKSNLAIEGVVTNAVSPTAISFASNVSATTGAYGHAVLLFTSGSLAGENSPIITYTNSNGAIVLEEALTSAPAVNDEFVIIAGSHVHSVASIKSGLSTLTAANVNAEVVDALSVDTYAELSAPPAATSSLKDKITWLFMYARNKVTQTALARTLYRDDTTTVAGTSATSDNGTTFTKGEDT